MITLDEQDDILSDLRDIDTWVAILDILEDSEMGSITRGEASLLIRDCIRCCISNLDYTVNKMGKKQK